MAKVININPRGTLTLPKELRRQLGLPRGGQIVAEDTHPKVGGRRRGDNRPVGVGGVVIIGDNWLKGGRVGDEVRSPKVELGRAGPGAEGMRARPPLAGKTPGSYSMNETFSSP